jgi:hypothetical protein
MDDIWTIIGLSSLIASVVTIVLGIARDVLVDKYRFKRQSEAGYIQNQIQIYSQIYFLLRRVSEGAVLTDLFGSTKNDIMDLNSTMKTKSDLLDSKVRGQWLALMASFTSDVEELAKGKHLDENEWEERRKNFRNYLGQLALTIKDIMNNSLIPKYRKIVGETVPVLD